jgi:hypothetical protein
MRRRSWWLLIVATLVLLGSALAVTAWVTEGRRLRDAQTRLDDGAARLQACHELRNTYDGCASGEELVTHEITDTRFELSVDVFGVGRVAVSGAGGGEELRTCGASTQPCSRGRW